MKLRKVGNSLGTTFSRDVLAKAQFSEGQDLEITATRGEIKIRLAKNSLLMVGLTPGEAAALVTGDLKSEDGKAAVAKVRQTML